jgi:hypothetical protein
MEEQCEGPESAEKSVCGEVEGIFCLIRGGRPHSSEPRRVTERHLLGSSFFHEGKAQIPELCAQEGLLLIYRYDIL